VDVIGIGPAVQRDHTLAVVTGWAAIGFSALYLISDLVELAQDGFSPGQLAITYAAEAAIPFLLLGLYALQRPAIGRLGLVSAAAYAYTFVFFTGTVLYALVADVPNWDALVNSMPGWINVHSVLMIVAGTGFGVAVVRARVLPRWTGLALIAGMVLIAVAAVLPAAAGTAAAAVRDLAFLGMGAAVLRAARFTEGR
jgi:hypothetical protein